MAVRAVFAVAFLLLAALAEARVDPAVYGDLHWRLIGPFRGGRVLTVAGVPHEPQHFYFGAVNGGVWETKDAGRTWQPIFDGQPVGSIGALAIAPSAPNVLYVGTGEADMRSDIAQGDGIYRSRDGGKTWAHVGLADSQQIGRILVDPHNANTVFVAALGHPYGPNAERGVFLSRDGGDSWRRVLGSDGATGAIDLAFEPGNPQTIYASLWQTRRTPWNIYPPANGPGSGLYKSSDGGEHWAQVRGNGFPPTVGRIGIDVARSDPKRVYAIVDGANVEDTAGGLYRSDDAGLHWIKTSSDPRIWQRGWYFGRITVDPTNADRVYVMNTIVLRSDDGGKQFIALKGDPTGDDFHELWIDPGDPQRQILGVDQGAIVTLNGGASWSSWHNQPTAQIYHVSTDRRFPYRVYGAQQDSGAAAVPSRTGDGDGITMREFHEVTAGGESDMIAPDPEDPDIVYGGRVDRLDLKSGQTRNVDPTLAVPALYRGTWTLPLAFSPRDPQALYFANQRVFRTRDGGQHWDAISPDLTREDPGAPANLDAVSAAHDERTGPRRGVVYALAPSPLDANLIWAGTDDGLVWLTRDGGAHWDNVTPSALTPWSKIGIIDASPFDSGSAYLAVDRHRLEDRRPYIYRTHDGGKSWQLVVAGIRDGDFVNAVREDPQRKGLLYAATELGVYVSFDDGDDWQPLQANLPRTSVRDLEVHDDDLVIATHGRGFWIMDDVTALRQIDAHAAGLTTRLYAPAPAIRLRAPGFTGTPLPKDEPLASNPPLGAALDYVLASAAKKPITLTIRDASGALVRRYASSDKLPSIDAATSTAAPEWLSRPSLLATMPGMHRFAWPLRYASVHGADADEDDGSGVGDGVLVPPGRYDVALEIDGRVYRQTLTIVPDPRVALSAEAYAEQFAFARQIEATASRVKQARAQAKALHVALADLRRDALAGKAPDASVTDVTSLDLRIVTAAGIIDAANPSNGWAYPATSTTSLRFLADSLGKLVAAVDSADAAPSTDARAGYAALAPNVETALAEWHTLDHDGQAEIDRTRRLDRKPQAKPSAKP